MSPQQPPDEATRGYADPEVLDWAWSWVTDDVPFYVDLARGARGPVLEAACGTGRVLLPMLQAGVDADGFDLSPAMLERLKQKAAALGLKPRVFRADMRDFTMPRRYALIVMPFRSFLHNLTSDDALRTLRVCREHLESGGRLVLNFFHPSFEHLTRPDGTPVVDLEFTHPGTGLPVRMVSTTKTDRVNQVRDVLTEIRETAPDGGPGPVHRHAFLMRWVYKAEMELMLRLAGFSRWEVRGGFDGRPLEKDTDEMVWTAWKD